MKNPSDSNSKWNETKGKLKQQFVLLTTNMPLSAKIDSEEILTKLQNKLGKTKEELAAIIAAP